MAEWDDAPLLSPEAAPKPPAPTQGTNPWDLAPISGARAKAVVNANASPDEAGKAVSIAKQTGIPASIVQTDIPGYDAHAKTQAAIQAVQNPAIASYVDKNPMASQVSNDDYSTLDKISGIFSKLGSSSLDGATTANLAEQTPIGDLIQSAPGREKMRGYLERMKSGFMGGFGEGSEVERMLSEAKGLGLTQKTIDFWEGSGLLPAARATEAGIRLVPGLIGGAFGAASGAVEQATGSSAWGDRLLREAPGANAALMGVGTTSIHSKFTPVDPVARVLAQDDLHQFLAENTPGGPRAKSLSAGETPEDQLWQAKPIIDQAKAEVAGAALDEAVSASQESKTKERSPELYEQFLAAHGDQGSVHIPAQSILDLYEKEGKVPMAGDGLFGFVPGLADKATLAAETGAEIKIPLSKYVANVNESVHEGLKDQIRVQPDGVTREEAKAQTEEQQAKIEAFHGTPHDFDNFDLSKVGTGEGAQVYGHGLYFAENRGVGEQYKLTTSEGKLIVGNETIDPANVKSEQAKVFLDRLNNNFRVNKQNTGTVANPDTIHEMVVNAYRQATSYGRADDELATIAKKVFQGVANLKYEDKGNLYKVHINADPTHFLDWDKPLSEQQAIWDKIAEHDTMGDVTGKIETGEDFYHALAIHLEDINKYEDKSTKPGGPGMVMDQSGRDASKMLAKAGIPGIKYLDQGSRKATPQQQIQWQKILDKQLAEGNTARYEELKKAFEAAGMNNLTRNFVVFDDKLVKIVEKNDNPVIQATVERAVAEKQSLGVSKSEPFLKAFLEDGKAVGITETEFKQYSNLIDRGQEAILDKAVGLAKREAAKRLTPEWKANEAVMRENVAAEMYNRPDFAADRFFNQGLNTNGDKLPPELRVKLGDPGVKADEYAEAFGFDTGTDLSLAVTKLESERAEAGKGPKWQFAQHVDAETARQMEAQYGHLADNIAIEASEAALADHNVDVLATEVKMLAKLNGREPPLNRTELTSWVKDQFDKSTASDVSYEQWRRASEKGGREAEKALLKKDYEESFMTKQRQLLSFLLAKEAKGFEKEVGRAEKLFDKYVGEVNLPAVDQAYTDQIHRLMQQYGIDTKRTQENTDYNLQGTDKDFANFVRDRNANGAMIVQADLPTPRAGANARPIDNFTVDQFRDFATMMKSLDHNGRAAKQIELAGKKEAFNEVIDKVTKNLDTLEKNDFDPDAKGLISGLRKLGRAVDSRLLKAEKLIDWIDKKDPLGAMNSSVLRGLIEGEQGKGDMITKLAQMAKDLPGDRAWGKGLDDLSNNQELRDWETGKLKKLSNENKIAIALNYGNKSNRRVMLEGYHWTEPEVKAYLSRELTPMDKAMVDGLHGLFEPLAPLVEKATSSRSGVAIPLVEGSPFEGMKGGYYPLVEDPRAKLLGQQVSTDLFQKTKFDPLPTANALKQRTGKVYPVDLTISQIHSRLSQTAHAVFMQDPVINANKVISDPTVREGIAKAFGPEYVQMLDKWIRDIADNGGSDVGMRDDAATWLSRNLRQNVTVQLMGWKASTALVHGGSAAASSAYENFKLHMPDENAAKAGVLAPARLVKDIYDLGLGQFLPNAARRFFGSQSNVFDGINFVQQKSGEMRNRQRSLQKDFGFQLDKITNSDIWDDAAKLRAVHQTYSMAMVAYLDQLTANPVWQAAYDHSLIEKGMEDADAVYTADKAVREAHGSASLVSRANIGRGEINKWLTIAYNGYWNHNYNKMREAGKEVGGYDDSLSNGQRVAIGAAFTTAMIVAPALVHHAVRGDSTGNPGKDIEGALGAQFAGTVPIVNTLVYSMMHNSDPSVSALDEVLKSASNVFKDQMVDQPKHTVKHAAQAEGYLIGLPPTNQAIDTFTFMNDVLHRRQDPKSVQEWARGVMTGSSQPKAHR